MKSLRLFSKPPTHSPVYVFNSIELCLRHLQPHVLEEWSQSHLASEMQDVCRTLSRATQAIVNLMRSTGKSTAFDLFLSHYKVQAGAEARILKDRAQVWSDLKARVFLDSDNLDRLDELSLLVTLSRNFVLLMSPHEASQKGTTAQYGPFGRPYCLIEIVTWYLNKQDIPAYVVVLEKNSLIPAKFPMTVEEVRSLLGDDDWAAVAAAVGQTEQAFRNLVFKASRLLATIQPFRWAPNGVDSEKQLRAFLDASIGKSFLTNQSSSMTKDGMPAYGVRQGPRCFIVAAQDTESEAEFISNKTHDEFDESLLVWKGNEYEANEDAVRQSQFVIVLLSPGILADVNCLKLIDLALRARCHIVPVEVSRHGLSNFDFRAPPGTTDASLADAFQQVKQIICKKLNMHAGISEIELNLTGIWGELGFEASRALKNIPKCHNIYDTPQELCAEFVPGTREWLFDGIVNHLTNSQEKAAPTFVVIGSAGTGKSSLVSEFARQHSPKLNAWCCKANKATSLDTGSTKQILVAAVHFFNFADEHMSRAENALGSIARQLASNVEGFRVALEKVNMADLDLRDLSALFHATLLEPAKIWQKMLDEGKLGNEPGSDLKGKRLVIVMDAFDECRNREKFNELLLRFWQVMPKPFALVISTRPSELGIEKVFHSMVLDSTANSAGNQKDMRIYLKNRLGSKASEKLVAKLEKIANGMFLYAKVASEQLLELKYASEDDLLSAAEALPSGMFGIYVQYFSRLQQDNFSMDLYAASLAPILASRVPLPETVWEEIVLNKSFPRGDGTQSSKLKLHETFRSRVKAHLVKLLSFSNGTVSMLHKSMDDFLRESSEAERTGLKVPVGLGHEAIAEHFVLNFKYANESWEGLADTREVYCARHGLYHLIMSGSERHVSTAVDNVLNIDNLMRMVTVCSIEGSMDPLIADIQSLLARYLRMNSPSASKIRYVCHVLELGARALLQDPRQLIGQLMGRLMIPALDAKGGISVAEQSMESHFLRECENWLARAKQSSQLKVAIPMGVGLSGLRPAGGPLRRLVRHDERIAALAVSHEGQVFAGLANGSVHVRSFSGKLIRIIPSHEKNVYALAVSHDSKILFTASDDGTVKSWDVHDGKLMRVFDVDEITYALAVSGKTEVFVVGTDNGTVKMFEPRSGKVLREFRNPASIYAIDVSVDGTRVFTGSTDGYARMWDASTGKLLCEFNNKGKVFGLKVSPDARYLFTGGDDKIGRVWSTVSGSCMLEFQDEDGYSHKDTIRAVAFSAISEVFFTASQDNTTRAWDFRTGKLLQTYIGHSDWVAAVCVTDDSRYLLTGADDQNLGVWDLNAETKKVVNLQTHSDLVRVVAISPDNKIVFTGSKDKTARAWEIQTGRTIWEFKRHKNPVRALAVSANSEMLFTGSPDCFVHAWSLKTGNCLRTFDHNSLGSPTEITALAVAPNLKILCSATNVNIHIWDVESAQHLRALNYGGLPEFSRLEVSLDSTILYAESQSWRIATGGPCEGTLRRKSETSQDPGDAFRPCAPNAVGFTQDDPSPTARQGDLFVAPRENMYECWRLV